MLATLVWSGPGYQSPSCVTVLTVWAGPRSARPRRAKDLISRDEARKHFGRPGFWGLGPKKLVLAG